MGLYPHLPRSGKGPFPRGYVFTGKTMLFPVQGATEATGCLIVALDRCCPRSSERLTGVFVPKLTGSWKDGVVHCLNEPEPVSEHFSRGYYHSQ